MTEDRETLEITTPLKGHKVVLRSWINGREKQKIDGSMFRGVQTVGDGTSLQPKLSEDLLANQENVSIECVVVSIDGNEIDVLNRVLEMRVQDYTFVAEQVRKIVDGDLDEKKELPSSENIGESLKEDEATSPTVGSL
jgi:hypothetical protein